jgi:regulator of protease activity HflC (stomatin/prohibitin superfamily)
MIYFAIFLIPLFLMFLFATIKMVPQYQRGVVFRLGKVKVPKGPGVVVVVPVLEKIIRVDMRTITHYQGQCFSAGKCCCLFQGR